MRINKYLALCGIASRRGCEKYVIDGKVKINGKKILSLSEDVNLENDTVTVDGIKVEPPKKTEYIMLNKPKGCLTTAKDDKGRKTVYDYLNSFNGKRLFPVGRLDYDSEGLLLFTNDGDLAYKLTHPKNEIPKTYSVKVEGEPTESELAKLRKGIEIEEGLITHKALIKKIEFKDGITKLQITIYEGKNREIRKMFEAINKEVVFLKRIAIGDLRLGGLGRGQSRHLSNEEIYYLKNL